MSQSLIRLAIVIPCFNEEEVLLQSSNRFSEILLDLQQNRVISTDSFILLVDDGSIDNTWSIILKLAEKSIFKGIKLSKNNGHQFAVLAGLETVRTMCDAAISIDADLQDDVLVIKPMIEKYKAGCEIVYGVRKKRTKDSFFKRVSAHTLYRLMKIMGVNIVYNHADFRLAGSRVIDILSSYQESNLFLRGIFPDIGLKWDTVEYERDVRAAGKSKYTLKKMIAFALEGITSFSIVPLRLVTLMGFLSFIAALGMTGWFFIQTARGNVLHGWSSTIISIYFFGAIQLISLGLIGEYVGKIYKEVKKRPRYIIEKKFLK